LFIDGPSGNVPIVALYDINGREMGRAQSNVTIADGSSLTLTMGGAEGSAISETPEYIQLVASGTDVGLHSLVYDIFIGF